MDNQLILTDLWIDEGFLMANDKTVGLIIVGSSAAFNEGPNDSLKRHWKTSSTGINYRKIRGTKRCFSPFPIKFLKERTCELGLTEKIEASYNKLKSSI